MNDQATPQPSWEENFVANMRRLREASAMTQTDLAKFLKWRYNLPFHQPTIQRIESRERPLRLDEAFLIAQTFGVELSTMTTRVSNTEHDRLYDIEPFKDVLGVVHSSLGELLAIIADSAEELVSELVGHPIGDLAIRPAKVWAWQASRVFDGLREAWVDSGRVARKQTREPASWGAIEVLQEWGRRDPGLAATAENAEATDSYLELMALVGRNAARSDG